MLHNLALRRQVPFLQEDEAGDGRVAAVEPVDSDEEEAVEEDVDNITTIIQHAAVCTANGLPRLNVRRGDSWVIMLWAYFCWRNGVGFGTAVLSLTFGVAYLCVCACIVTDFYVWVIIHIAVYRRTRGMLAAVSMAVSGTYRQCHNEGLSL
ncbi:hypothetical protein NDU88_002980 [Pleurodeles waltl]|uniref:Uncharacterized protein n=1 Tax=Pleurodeles waltl TaxID=8319 RepID=A0AAV7LE08_PLEWA|nr:hypothetical protein NDU88_002980 [Pleurodeles waltl]